MNTSNLVNIEKDCISVGINNFNRSEYYELIKAIFVDLPMNQNVRFEKAFGKKKAKLTLSMEDLYFKLEVENMTLASACSIDNFYRLLNLVLKETGNDRNGIISSIIDVARIHSSYVMFNHEENKIIR